MSQRIARKLLLVGWDSADWQIINPLLEQGRMPALNHLINNGVMGNLATMEPIISPMLWNSIATGKRPDKHGILGFIEPDPDNRYIRPFTSTSRKCKALWNILTQREMTSQVVAWFAGHPAEPIRGTCVSELFQKATGALDQPWIIKPGTVHPPELAESLAALRVHPGELEANMILPFVPDAAKVDQSKDKHLATLARMLAETISVHSAATELLEHQPWDFAAIYYDAIDHLSHAFMQFHPPRLKEVIENDFELYKNVVSCCYQFHDLMLGRLIQLAGPDAHVMVISDHGFYSDHLRPRGIPDEPSGPTVCHRPFGIFCMSGPGIQKDHRIYGAGILDIAPTVLTLFGLPVGRDMDGKVLAQAFDQPPEIERISSWEDVPGESGMHPVERRRDPLEAQEAINQLVALGYMEPLGEDKEKAVLIATQEIQYNLAIVLLDGGKPQEALPLLVKLAVELPDRPRMALLLAQCHQRIGNRSEARRIVESVFASRADSPLAHLLMGSLLFSEGKPAQAIHHLRHAEKAAPCMPGLHCTIGSAYIRRRMWRSARRAFAKALRIDGDSPIAHEGMARCQLAQRQWEQAAESALRAVGLLHCFPAAHYALGLALLRLNKMQRAVQALETCLYFKPDHVRANVWLGRIYLRVYKDNTKAQVYFDRAASAAKQGVPVFVGK
jgi:predicted AlkP superfamily phosphohydrolase/phosphomutase/Tfp pilus assembly protein PilF